MRIHDAGMTTPEITRLVCARFSPDPELLGMVDEPTQRWAWDESNKVKDRRPQLGSGRGPAFGAATGPLIRMAAGCWDDDPAKRDKVGAVLDGMATSTLFGGHFALFFPRFFSSPS